MTMCTPRDLLRWFEDAQHAVDTAAALTIDQCRALAAQPSKLSPHECRTYYSEELALVAVDAARDTYPMGGDEADVAAWRQRQDHARQQCDALAESHAAALAAAVSMGAVRPIRSARPKPARVSAAELALRQLAPGSDRSQSDAA
jgi:hypothetical protein